MHYRRLFLLCLLVFLFSSSAWADLWITGYYPGYRTSVMNPTNIDFSTVTHVVHFALIPEYGGSIDSTTNDLTDSNCTEMVSLGHNAGRKALVCVGGAGTEGAFQGAASPPNIGLFVTNIINFVTKYGYDGVNIDWEPLYSSDASGYTNLIVDLRAALNALGTNKLLTVAAPPYPRYDDPSPSNLFGMFPQLQGDLDQISVMTYDLSQPSPGWVTWYESPLYDGGYTFPNTSELVPSINASVSNNYLAYGCQPEKLGIGLPFYGYVWTGGPGMTQPLQAWPSDDVPTVTTPSYTQIIEDYYRSGLYHWDNVAQAAYLSITNTPPSDDMFISYDDAHSCQVKVSYARNLHLGGLILWELSDDYFPGQPPEENQPLDAALKQSLATPAISGVQLNDGAVSFNFSTLPLGLYSIQWSSNLASPTWNILTNNVAGTGTNVLVTDPAATQTERFYRIQTPP